MIQQLASVESAKADVTKVVRHVKARIALADDPPFPLSCPDLPVEVTVEPRRDWLAEVA